MFKSVEEIKAKLAARDYLIDDRVAISVFLAQELKKPLLIEGPAGVGKTELAKVLAEALETDLIRLQCYEGLDEAKALYEWNYQKQLLYIQARKGDVGSWEETRASIFTEEFCLERPILKALKAKRPVVLLIDELDKSDDEFESFLLEALSDFQVTIPELGTIRATTIPLVIITSNNTREFSDALKRRCIHLFLDYPSPEKEREIILRKVPGISEDLANAIVQVVNGLRKMMLKKPPSISETLDWARTLLILGKESLDPLVVENTLNILLKYQQDINKVLPRLPGLVAASGGQGS